MVIERTSVILAMNQRLVCVCFRNIIPDNLFEATFAQTQTKYKVDEQYVVENSTGEVRNATIKHVKKYLGRMENANIIGNLQ